MQSNNGAKLEVTREFDVPVEQLYTAWIQPEALKQWWHPMGNKLEEVTNDVKEGGAIAYRFTDETGRQMLAITGTYEEVQEKEKLVYTWNWEVPGKPVADSPHKLTVLFQEGEGGSRLQVTQEDFKDEAVHPHREGWEKSLDDLHQYLSAAGQQ